MDMAHMGFIRQVAETDLEELERKEKTYRGSWKKRGGVGAAMMMLRKADRLEGMLEARKFDVFEDVGDGSDGTMIAEIRDLRRYLLLVEAELEARAAGARDKEQKLEDLRRQFGGGGSVSMTCKTDILSQPSNGGGGTRKPPTTTLRTTDGRNIMGTPEDGGHHARQSEPWVMERLDDGLPEDEVGPDQRFWYRKIVTVDGSRLIVDRARAPEGMWMHLPRLSTELNNKEHEEIPIEYQALFAWSEGGSKWTLRDEYREHWGKQ